MAGEGDAERLVVLLEARTNDALKAMDRAEKKFDKAYGQMRRGSRTATQQMEADMNRTSGSINRAIAATSGRMGTFARSGLSGLTAAFVAGVAPILSVAAALNTAKEALSEFDSIGKRAKSAGIDAEFFQELSYSAQLGGVEVAQLSQALDTLNRNAGMAAVGKGELVEKLKLLHPELLKNIVDATDQEQRIRLVADALDRETDASRKAALAAAVFGDAGVKMVEMLKGGAAALDETARKARSLGLVIDNDLIARSEALNDEFSTATRVMDLQFKQALVDLAPVLIETARLAGGLATAIGYITDSMQELSNRSTERLRQDLASIDETLAQANATYSPGVVGTMGVEIDPQAQAKLKSERDSIFAELVRRKAAEMAIDRARSGSDGAAPPRAVAADATIKQADAVKELIANLQFEQEQLGRNADEQELYNMLKQAGVTRESEFGQAIEGSLGPLQAQRAEIERNAEMMEMLGDLGKTAVNGIIDALADGKIEAEEFGNILSDVLGMAGQFFLNAAFGSLGGGGGGNFFSSLFGGFRAGGGPVEAGKAYVVGEKRPELFVPSQPGTIIPQVPSGGGDQTINATYSITNNITLTGKATEEDGAAYARGFAKELDRHFPAAMERYQRNPMRRAG